MQTLQIVCLMGMLVGYSHGLICFNCTAGSLDDCLSSGLFVDCPSHTEVCATSYSNTTEGIQIVKQCKEVDDCLADEAQNWPNRCANDGSGSECHCCCFTDWCRKDNDCEPVSLAATCHEFPSNLPHGDMDCSDSFNVGSICEFSCSEEDYSLNPSANSQLTCLPNGKWNKPTPCCSKDCENNLRMDLVSMIYRRWRDTYNDSGMSIFLQRMNLNQIIGVRFARVRYSQFIHRPLLLFNNTADLSGLDILEELRRHDKEPSESTDLANTGNALTEIYNQWVTASPRDVPKAIVMHTDANSDDNVTEIAANLRNFGVTIFPYFWLHGEGDAVPDEQKLFEIAGYKRPFLRGLGSNEGNIGRETIGRYCPYLCDGYGDPK